MALNAAQQWWVRAGGVETNGGGYDATVSGAGTNYSDQDAPQLSLTDLVSTASTTVTSVAAGFTSAMVGNILRIASGTGTPTVGYYMITTYTSATQITLDRVSGTYTLGIAKVGGAHASLVNYSNGGSGLPTPAIASPLAAGHTVNIRGSGGLDAALTTIDYDYSAGYWAFPAGNTTVGSITFVGYNGRPNIRTNGLWANGASFTNYYLIKMFPKTAAGITSLGMISSGSGGAFTNVVSCIFDANGNDCILVGGASAVNSEFRNTGGGASGGTYYGISGTFPSIIKGCYIHNLRGDGIRFATSSAGSISNCIIANNGGSGINIAVALYGTDINGNTITGNTSDGIKISVVGGLQATFIYNNIITNNGGYGVNVTVGTSTSNAVFTAPLWMDYNNVWTNTTANYHNVTAGPHDISLDPQYVASGSFNWAIGANMQGKGFPTTIAGSASVSSVNLGAVYPAAGGSNTYVINQTVNRYFLNGDC